MSRAMQYRVFQRRYQPSTPPSRGDFWRYADAVSHDPENVWSVVDGDNGRQYLCPGFHVVNATGQYAICAVPHQWTDRVVLY